MVGGINFDGGSFEKNCWMGEAAPLPPMPTTMGNPGEVQPPEVPRAKFLGSNGLFCFINICKFGSFENPIAMISNLSELYFRIRRFILSIQMKKVISINCGSSAQAAENHGDERGLA